MSLPNDLRDLNVKVAEFAWTPALADQALVTAMTAPALMIWAHWTAAWTAWGDLTAKALGLATPSSIFFPETAGNENAPVARLTVIEAHTVIEEPAVEVLDAEIEKPELKLDAPPKKKGKGKRS